MRRLARRVGVSVFALATSVASAQSLPSPTYSAPMNSPASAIAPAWMQTPTTPAPTNLPMGMLPDTPMPSPAPIPAPVPCPPPDCQAPAPPPAPFDWSKVRLGGQYRVEFDTNNFGYHPVTLSNNQPNETFINQRFRTWLTYTPTDNVEGYIQVQVGGINWGSDFDLSKTFAAGGQNSPVGGDQVGVELRRAWLAVHDDVWGRVRVGILDWHDSFNDTLASSDYDFNVGGIDWQQTVHDLNEFTVHAAMLLLSDQAFVGFGDGLNPGAHSAYLFALDADQPLANKVSVGASAYYLTDRGGYSYPTIGPYSSSWDLWLGVRGKIDVEPLPMSGFAILNTGGREDFGPPNFNHTGWAGQFQLGPIPVGCGKLTTQVVYSSGDSNPGTGSSQEFRTVAQTARDNFGAQGYWSYLSITSPNGPNDVADLGVGLQDQGYGLFAVMEKFEYPLAARLSGTTAAGWLRSDKANITSGSFVIGPEIAQMFTYNFGGGMTLDVGAAVLFTGDFYRAGPTGPSPDNLYEGFARFQLEF